MTSPAGIDPRGPRFGAALTSLLLLVTLVVALLPRETASFGWFASQPIAGEVFVPGTTVAQRLTDPAFLLAAIVALLFLWGILSPRTHPWNLLFRSLVRPRLAPPAELEDPRPPRFAQGVGLVVVAIGLVLHLAGVPYALVIAVAAAFVAAFLNAAFGFCLGCQIYLLLQRVRPAS
ncbi:DUF4395 domain-containing protein [Microbacterium sp. No. 7]|uniref:DUF4395 domain-containing protein n=1 Tax=Microbacterium sp. No. 7 TaxID=1714373 RepID=UPI0006D26B2D|nr:DUF4395 domain-containing protein [Microbacterium sp. No. 7]ALJ21056.1 hypothetical protein AOA12_14565 [Microbacterium sp. No. 7]